MVENKLLNRFCNIKDTEILVIDNVKHVLREVLVVRLSPQILVRLAAGGNCW